MNLGHLLRRFLLSFGVAWCAQAAFASLAAAASFYDWTVAEAKGRPGTIIRAERLTGAPQGATAWRVLYRSTGLKDEPIAVSGLVIAPSGALPGDARPVVAWAHPTSGIVPKCAPSLALQVFRSIQGLQEMLSRGYVVAATDYPGLGTAGPHPYLIGRSEAQAVLDSVRAAGALPQSGAGARFAVWGHSQGGQAALFAGRMARDYAPELTLTGIATAAPATDLATLLKDDFATDGGRNLTAMALYSWSRLYGLSVADLVKPQAMPAVDALAGECIESVFDMLERMVSQRGLRHGFLTVPDLASVEPWRSILVANIPGPLPADVPLFVAQGDADRLVLPEVTHAYARAQCRAGGAVRLLMVPGAVHGFIARDSASQAVDWIGDRFAGRAAPTDCAAIGALPDAPPGGEPARSGGAASPLGSTAA